MYGMIHKSIHSMVVEELGEEEWDAIARKANVDDSHFLSMKSYDDHVVYDLVATSADHMGLTAEEILRDFGKHFIKRTVKSNYTKLVKTYGRDTFSLLSNMNRLHSSMSTTFIGYRPPSLLVTQIEPGEIFLTYESTRIGLTPFVKGLVYGLGELFSERLQITEEVRLEVPVGESTRFRILREI